MHVVLINHYAGSPAHGMEFRPHQLARHWVAAGHDVTILAGSWSHLRNANPELAPGTDERRGTIDGIGYRWLRTRAYAGNGVKRLLSIHEFVRRIDRRRAALVREHRPDVVIASSTYPFDVGPAGRLARAADCPLVWEVHDLWPLSPIELAGMSPRHPFIVLTQRAEDRACRTSDLVVSMLPRAIDHLRTRGLDEARYRVVPNGVDVDALEAEGTPEPPGPAAAALGALRDAGAELVVGYAGSHTDSYGLDVLLDAAARTRDARIAFLLVGDGPAKAALEADARARGLDHVRFLPRLTRREAMGTMRACDAIFVGLRAQSLFRFGIGMNKIFDAMLMARPIVACYTAGNDPVGEAGAGPTVPAGDAAGLAEALTAMRDRTSAERDALGAAGERFVRAHHDAKVLAARFLDELEAVRDRHAGAAR